MKRSSKDLDGDDKTPKLKIFPGTAPLFSFARRKSDPPREYSLDSLKKSRHWKYTNAAFKLQKTYQKGLDFTVMSYNVLSQTLLEKNAELYKSCDQNCITWEYRKPLILKDISSHLADIICLQEVEEAYFNEVFVPNLSTLGYKGLYKKKTGARIDGCAIFYKESVFSLDHYKTVEFRTPKIRLLDRDDIGLIAVFTPKSTKYDSAKICVATTHIVFDPKRGDVKLAQIVKFLAEIEKMAFKEKDDKDIPIYWPVLICGDMNTVPFSPIYHYITKGNIVYEKLLSSAMSGQLRHEYLGRMVTVLSVDLEPIGINCQTRYSEELLKAKEEEEKKRLEEEEEAERERERVEAERVKAAASRSPLTMLDYKMKTFNSTLFEHRDSPIKFSKRTTEEPGFYNHGFNFLSAYGHYCPDGFDEVTTINSTSHVTVDYIFYSVRYSNPTLPVVQKQACDLQRLGSYTLLNAKHFKDIESLPNSFLPSDHLYLITRLLLTP